MIPSSRPAAALAVCTPPSTPRSRPAPDRVRSAALSATDAFRARRAALRLLTYGLYAVTVRHGEERSAFTANWLTQVSFDPPLIALSVENESRSIGIIRASGGFTVNVLPRDAVDVAGMLGRRSVTDPDKLSRVEWDEGPSGRAVLRIALVAIDCEVESSLPAGDSTIFVARIAGATMLREGEPLRMSDTPYKHAG